MLPKAGTLESFGVTSIPVLQNSKVEEKKCRSPQGDKQTKENLFKFKIYLEIKVSFHQDKKEISLLVLPVKKSHLSQVIVAFENPETRAVNVCAAQSRGQETTGCHEWGG